MSDVKTKVLENLVDSLHKFIANRNGKAKVNVAEAIAKAHEDSEEKYEPKESPKMEKKEEKKESPSGAILAVSRTMVSKPSFMPAKGKSKK